MTHTQNSAAVERAAWDWLDKKSITPEDFDFSADEMVDAFIAGHAALSPHDEIAKLREALRKARDWLESEDGSRMGPAETRQYNALMSKIEAALGDRP